MKKRAERKFEVELIERDEPINFDWLIQCVSLKLQSGTIKPTKGNKK